MMKIMMIFQIIKGHLLMADLKTISLEVEEQGLFKANLETMWVNNAKVN